MDKIGYVQYINFLAMMAVTLSGRTTIFGGVFFASIFLLWIKICPESLTPILEQRLCYGLGRYDNILSEFPILRELYYGNEFLWFCCK